MMDFDPGSFKDPDGRVFFNDGKVLRALTESGIRNWEKFSGSAISSKIFGRGDLVPTHVASPGFLEHQKIPFISYGYEWPFKLLKRAAILHLELLKELIPEGFILKDATPFNVQFQGIKPIFIDVTSVEPLKDGDVWGAYGQFCDMMLDPLILSSKVGVDFKPWLMRSFNGISAMDLQRILSPRHLFNFQLLKHVYLRGILQSFTQDSRSISRSDIQLNRFDKKAILSNLNSLSRLIESLSFTRAPSHWAEYTESSSYEENQIKSKKDFVTRHLSQWRPKVVLDVGANTGEYSEIASGFSELVVAVDQDESAIDSLCSRLERNRIQNILPLVMNWAFPTPSSGWGNIERKSFLERIKPDVILYLATIHHLALVDGIKISMQLELLSSMTRHLIIEFVHEDDPMVSRLIKNMSYKYPSYSVEKFMFFVQQHFRILSSEKLSPTRTIFSLEKN